MEQITLTKESQQALQHIRDISEGTELVGILTATANLANLFTTKTSPSSRLVTLATNDWETLADVPSALKKIKTRAIQTEIAMMSLKSSAMSPDEAAFWKKLANAFGIGGMF